MCAKGMSPHFEALGVATADDVRRRAGLRDSQKRLLDTVA
jgi:hypothetical protein